MSARDDKAPFGEVPLHAPRQTLEQLSAMVEVGRLDPRNPPTAITHTVMGATQWRWVLVGRPAGKNSVYEREV